MEIKKQKDQEEKKMTQAEEVVEETINPVLTRIDSMVAGVPQKKRKAFRASLERMFNVTKEA
jgi:hypothetical protein